MKYLKTYEKHYHNEPNEGDYVICKKEDYYNNDILNNFYQTTIGKIIFIDVSMRDKTYKVEYQIPIDKKGVFKAKITPAIAYYQNNTTRQIFDRDEILYFSKNREYLETILDANKYNL